MSGLVFYTRATVDEGLEEDCLKLPSFPWKDKNGQGQGQIGWGLVVEDIELLFKMTMRCVLPPH